MGEEISVMSLKFLSAVIPLEIGHVSRQKLNCIVGPHTSQQPRSGWLGGGEGPGTVEGKDCHPLRHSGTPSSSVGEKMLM